MDGIITCTILYLLILVPAALSSIKKIEENTAGVIVRLGRFHRIALPGITFIWPVFDKITIVNTSEQKYDLSFQSIKTKDDRVIRIKLVCNYQVIEPEKASADLNNLDATLKTLILHTLVDLISEVTYNKTNKFLIEQSKELQKRLNIAISQAGIKISKLRITDIELQN
ncbi:MAG: SPFH domain-containing protein [Cyanobacteriota bacterium]